MRLGSQGSGGKRQRREQFSGLLKMASGKGVSWRAYIPKADKREGLVAVA